MLKYSMWLVLSIFIITYSSTNNAFAHAIIIKGELVSNNSQAEPIVGANVKIIGTQLGAVSDKNGNFVIKRVPEGVYELIVTCIGYKPFQQAINLNHHSGTAFNLVCKIDEAPVNTSTVVVTATKSDKIYEDVPIKMSSIDFKSLEKTPSINIREGLQYQPGVRTEVNCQNCGFSQVRLNGLEGKYSQILIDGKSVFSALNGVYGLDQIPVGMIDKIEIIRGGGSSLYGGNAVAGVINIITKEACQNSFNINYQHGFTDNKKSDLNLTINGSVTSDDDAVGMFFWGNMNDRQAWDANGDGYSEIGKMKVLNLGAKVYYKPSSADKISFELYSIYHKIRGGDSLDLPPHMADIAEEAQHNTISGQAAYEHLFNGGLQKINAFVAFQTTTRNSYYGSHKDPNAYGLTDNNSYNAGIQYNFVLDSCLGNHVFTLGYDLNYDWMKDKAPSYHRIIDQEVYANGIYFQDDWQACKQLDLLLGARIDKHNLINDLIFNPRISAIYKLINDLSLRSTFSTGYRAPQAFDEDLHITQVGGKGYVIKLGDNLKPEYSTSFSSSVDYSFLSLGLPVSISLEYFNTYLKNAFVLVNTGTDESGNILMTRLNGSEAKVYGMTFEVQSQINNSINLKCGITSQSSLYSDPVEWSSGISAKKILPQYSDKILRTPNLYGYLLSSYQLGDFSTDLSAVYTGSMYVPHYSGYIEYDILKKTSEFLELNVKFSYKIKNYPDLILSTGFNNILNSYQRDFDEGINRDAGYIYGPFKPFSTFFEIKYGI